MRMIACLALILLVAGCATPTERAAQLVGEIEEMIQHYGPACEKLGYKNDSDPWRDCILQLNARDNVRNYIRHPGSGLRHRGFPY
jgi:hypothetical protein